MEMQKIFDYARKHLVDQWFKAQLDRFEFEDEESIRNERVAYNNLLELDLVISGESEVISKKTIIKYAREYIAEIWVDAFLGAEKAQQKADNLWNEVKALDKMLE